MSIFPGLSFINWTPTVTTTAPMTLSNITINLAKYALHDSACFFYFHISFTPGGTLSAASIDLTPPVIISNVTNFNYIFVAQIFTGVAILARGIIGVTSNQLRIAKASDAGDVAWAAVASSIQGEGFYNWVS